MHRMKVSMTGAQHDSIVKMTRRHDVSKSMVVNTLLDEGMDKVGECYEIPSGRGVSHRVAVDMSIVRGVVGLFDYHVVIEDRCKVLLDLGIKEYKKGLIKFKRVKII